MRVGLRVACSVGVVCDDIARQSPGDGNGIMGGTVEDRGIGRNGDAADFPCCVDDGVGGNIAERLIPRLEGKPCAGGG